MVRDKSDNTKEETESSGETQAENQAPPAPEPTLEEQLEAAQAEAMENLDKFLRAKAETENARRRAGIEIANAYKFAIEQFAGELLAVRDSLELASAIDLEADNKEALKKIHEGIALTLKQLDSAFDKHKLTTVDPKGEKFDPERHQAMSIVETGDVAPNHIVDVVQKGYLLHERLLRPAMVIVAKAQSGEKPKAQEKTEESDENA